MSVMIDLYKENEELKHMIEELLKKLDSKDKEIKELYKEMEQISNHYERIIRLHRCENQPKFTMKI